MLTDRICTSRGEDLILWVTVEPLCVYLKSNKVEYQLYLNLKKKIKGYSFSSYVALSKLIDLSEHQFPQLKMNMVIVSKS